MSISNQDIDSILNNLFRNGLGVNNHESIFNAPTTFSASSPDATVLRTSASGSTTHENANNRRSRDVHINNRTNVGIESLIMLLSELNNRTNTQRTPSSNTRNSNNTTNTRSILYTEFEEMIYSYNRNILEYNHTIQQMIDGISSSTRTRRGTAIGITEIYETGLQFNRNIHEYNKNMDNAMELYRDIHFGYNSRDRTNYSVPLSRNSETTTTPVTPVTTNTLPVISRPQSMVSYTIFPFTPSVATEPDEILLSEIQIHDFTESLIYNSNDSSSNISTTVCPISLESFQEGDSILKIRHCGHEFKSVSLRQWFRRSSRCPLCRCNLLTPLVNRTSRSPSVANSSEQGLQGTEAPWPMNVSDADNVTDIFTQNQVILPDTLISNNSNSNIIRELYTTLLNTTNDLDQSRFNDVFQTILMESTEAPPNITNVDVVRGNSVPALLTSVGDRISLDSIQNVRPLIMSLLQNSLSSSIESIDITYTVDYDISNN